jgi:hypothetical protein
MSVLWSWYYRATGRLIQHKLLLKQQKPQFSPWLTPSPTTPTTTTTTTSTTRWRHALSRMSIVLHQNPVNIKVSLRSANQRHSTSSSPDDWRKQQLQALQQKFDNNNNNNNNNNVSTVDSDETLQPLWKEMERRVTRRKPRMVKQQQQGQQQVPTGRVNIRKTDEDVWAQEGMYDVQPGKIPSTSTSSTSTTKQ